MNDERTTVDVGDLLASGGKVFYSSDPHYFHTRIIELSGRPFRDVHHMNTVLVDNHNAVVGPGDTSIILGDILLGQGFEQNIEILSRLNGRLILMPGNHDRLASTYHQNGSRTSWVAKRERYAELYGRYFDVVLSDRDRVIRHLPGGDETVVLSHYPYQGDSHDGDRFEAMRPADDGHSFVVHGHVHEKWQRNGRQLNVGVDVNYFTPVSEETVIQWIKEQRALRLP